MAVVLADARAATALAYASFAVVLADARAATALACASFAVVLTDARAPTLAAYALFAIVGALFADPRHLQSALCFLLFLNATSPHSLRLRQVDPALLASPSSLTGRPLLRPQAGEARSAGSCGLSRGSKARASPSSVAEKQRVLVGCAEEARHGRLRQA